MFLNWFSANEIVGLIRKKRKEKLHPLQLKKWTVVSNLMELVLHSSRWITLWKESNSRNNIRN